MIFHYPKTTRISLNQFNTTALLKKKKKKFNTTAAAAAATALRHGFNRRKKPFTLELFHEHNTISKNPWRNWIYRS